MNELARRRCQTVALLEKLRASLGDAEQLALGKACVYATGSFGRHEASEHSDLDLFIVGKNREDLEADEKRKSLLGKLDEFCTKADLIKATRTLGIPDFGGEGRYLVHYSVDDLVETFGNPEDDMENTFTAQITSSVGELSCYL